MAEQPNSWACAACTFVNDNPLYLCCSMCGTVRQNDQVEENAGNSKSLSMRRQSVSRDISQLYVTGAGSVQGMHVDVLIHINNVGVAFFPNQNKRYF